MSKNDNDQRLANRVRTTADEKDINKFSYEKLLVPPSVAISEEPTICYQVNREWNKYISGAISLLLEIAVWRDAEDETYEAIQQVSNLLLGSECGGGMDCDDCLSTSDIIKYINNRTYQLENQVTGLQGASEVAAYNAAGNNIQTYNPTVPSYFHTGSGTSQLAFCLAAEHFAKDLAERLYNFASFQLGLSILTRDIGSALGWAARAFPVWFTAVAKLVQVTGLYGVATYSEMITVVSDEVAVNSLICQLRGLFANVTTERASYDSTIAAINTTNGSVNANKFATMAKTYCNNTEAYLYFCNLVGSIQGQDLTGYICVCPPGYFFNFQPNNQSWIGLGNTMWSSTLQRIQKSIGVSARYGGVYRDFSPAIDIYTLSAFLSHEAGREYKVTLFDASNNVLATYSHIQSTARYDYTQDFPIGAMGVSRVQFEVFRIPYTNANQNWVLDSISINGATS